MNLPVLDTIPELDTAPVEEHPDSEGAVENVPFDPASLQEEQGEEPLDVIKYNRNRKEEACSKQHLLTHLPKNPYCVGCLRAKMNAKRVHKHQAQSSAKAFGDIVTADHLIARNADGDGIDKEKVAIVIKDHFTGWVEIYPAAGKSAGECELAIGSFQGTKKK